MSLHDDFDINISQNEDSELSEKEYSDILGLEGMAGGGEIALEEETEEEKEEDTLVYIFAEQQNQKQKPAYRRYTHDEMEERQEIELPIPEHREHERKRDGISEKEILFEPDITGYETLIPLDQMENWKNSSITEKEAVSDEKYTTTEYWNYLQSHVSDYARSVQLENEQLYRDVDVAGVSAVFSQFDSIHTDINGEKSNNSVDVTIKKDEQILHTEIKSIETPIQESIQIPISEQYTSPNKTFRQEEMVEVFSYAKKQENKGTALATFESVKAEATQEIAQGQSEKTSRDVNVAGISNAEGQKDTAAEQRKLL